MPIAVVMDLEPALGVAAKRAHPQFPTPTTAEEMEPRMNADERGSKSRHRQPAQSLARFATVPPVMAISCLGKRHDAVRLPHMLQRGQFEVTREAATLASPRHICSGYRTVSLVSRYRYRGALHSNLIESACISVHRRFP